MKRKALKLALPFMLLIGGVGCGSNAIDEEHAIVSKEDAKKEDIYAGNLLQLNKEFNTIIEDLAIAEEKGYSSESSKAEFEEKFKQAKSVTAQMRRLAPSSKYKDAHKKVSQATAAIDKSFNKQLDAIKQENSTKLKEATDSMNEPFDKYLEGISDVNDIYLKEIEDIAETLGK
ncbi:TPA: hypothetical protein QCN73_005975 [Bacillus wiedmannii]|jgi:DNA anti-recombination protein RmuC|uniref:hypothetical protein n=1 Tax=Bacillus cereus TaxID=1396 RepID=UPI0013752411|nr:hypothetical protein [Bacillus cereus]MEB9552851.1 hypothetical protein [Bacillus cereus]MEB9571338.1 hypothetical protein [Bacillus cereus]HDR3494341.1 hypothetical protein [Bacillus wiedmannii]HDX9500084.1 hypothetical protein [Bacillus thuringiensis]